MVTIRTTNDLVLSLLDYFKASMPDATMNPGSVIRDLFVDAPSSIIALLYDELSKISNLQSLRIVSGNDLDRLAQNYGVTRKVAQQATGTALYTFASLPATVSINAGDILTATNGLTFTVVNGVSVNPSMANSYKSIAVQYQNNLNFLNITDPYAVEVSAQASVAGVNGNISNYSITSTSTVGVSNVTNVFPFTGGSNQEDDATFRNRVLAIFSGSNIGTALGYQNIALSDNQVEDAAVIGPGNPLMTRDGTVVQENSNGSYTILSEGTGGKVDVVILGERELQYTDTFIYQDKSNQNDPTNAANNFVLGQIAADAGLTITQRRINDIANGTLPAQPVDSILSVTGSKSGANFLPKSVNSLGVVSGNYELIKDTGPYGGSPWGSDTFAWISNQIVFNENLVKSQFNGQDATTFSNIIELPNATQNISITNENSQISTTDQSIIQLLHTPATNVTRVFNVNTGERYTVINQNLNGAGSINSTGQIQISGNTLPSPSNILQVDYTWLISYDPFSDYDGKILDNNPRPSDDSVDWGISNAIRTERILFSQNSTNTLFVGSSKHVISSVIEANIFSTTNGVVSISEVVNFVGRTAITLSALDSPINSIESVKLVNTNEELYFTAEDDGDILNTTIVVGESLKYNVTLILPTDSPAIVGNEVNIVYNQSDAFNVVGSSGSVVANQITIPSVNITPAPSQIYLDVTYIAAVQNILTAGITNFPLSRSGNTFNANSSIGSINAITSNTIRRETQTIQENASDQLYVSLSISSSSLTMIASQVVSVIDLRTYAEIWNSSNQGTLTTNTSGNYELIFSGYNAPAVGDNVLVLYFADDLINTQPFTFNNRVFSRSFQTLEFNYSTNEFYIPIQTLTAESGLSFSIIDTTTGLSDGYASDGYLSGLSSNRLSGTFTSNSFSFALVDNILGKNISITSSNNPNNIGTFSVLGYNSSNNTLTIGTVVANINPDQVSVIRIESNDDLWSSTIDSIDPINNILSLPSSINAIQGDKVVVLCFTNKNLHQSPTRVALTTTDQINNTGVVTLLGTTVTKVANVVFTAITNGLTQNVLPAILTFLNSTATSIPSNNYLIRVVQLQNVSVTTGNQVTSVLTNYDVEGTQINNNLFYTNEMLYNESLSGFEFTLPSTTNNLTNAPVIGDTLNITFYYATDNNSESLYFTKNGTLYTNNKFATIEQVYISSGFNASSSVRFTLAYFTQPATGSRYISYYNYLAPQENERIVIQSNYNALVSDVTFDIEAARPITADVLVKESKELLIDATVSVIISTTTSIATTTIIQNVQSAVTAAINSNVLGGTISFSDLVTAAQTVSGVANATLTAFNIDGANGMALTITAQQNQSFVANTIIVNQGTD
jgi:uncharacterized phage protein gp47/JayE